MTKLVCLLMLVLSTAGLAAAQGNVDRNTADTSSTKPDRNLARFRFRRANEVYNQLYLYNADLGFITPPSADAFAPKRYLLTSDVTPHYFVVASSRFRGSLVFTPRTKVRILNERSQPVRTPSFMPALTYYRRLTDDTKRYRYMTVNATHHSNGQDGPERLANGQFNTVTGSFSTNFVELGYHWGVNNPMFGGTNTGAITNYKVAVAQHISSDDVLTNRYGFTRLNAKINWIKLGHQKPSADEDDQTRQAIIVEKHRLTLNAQWIFGMMYNYTFADVSRRLTVEMNYYYRLPFEYANSYLYAAVGYYGQDPYNIYFNDHYGFVRIGAAFGISVYKNRSGENPVTHSSAY